MTSNSCTDPGHRVVVNQEEQYSLWPARKPNAAGWVDAGFFGSKEECLAYICKHWTDMRPLSLRQAIRRTAVDRSAGQCQPDSLTVSGRA